MYVILYFGGSWFKMEELEQERQRLIAEANLWIDRTGVTLKELEEITGVAKSVLRSILGRTKPRLPKDVPFYPTVRVEKTELDEAHCPKCNRIMPVKVKSYWEGNYIIKDEYCNRCNRFLSSTRLPMKKL